MPPRSNWLVPTDHRHAAGWFLAACLVHMTFAALFGAALSLNLVSPTGALLELDRHTRLCPPHGLLAVHFAVVPLLFAVGGLALVPPSVGANRVALPWLLPPNCYFHLTTVALAAGGVFEPLWHVVGLAVVYLSLGLVSANLLVTVVFGRGMSDGRGRVPVFAWAMCLSAVSINSGFLLSLSQLWAAAAGPPPLGVTWDLFPHLGQLLPLLVAVPSTAVLVEVALVKENESRQDPAVTFARWAAVVVLVVVWLGHTAGSVVLTLSTAPPIGWIRTVVEVGVPVVGATLTTIAFALAAIVGAVRETFRDVSVVILAVAGMLVGLLPLFLLVVSADMHLHDTQAVPAGLHAQAAAVVCALLAALLKGWKALTGREYSRLPTAVGCGLFALGVTGAVGAHAAVGWMGMPQRYPNYPEEFQPLNVAAGVASGVAGLGLFGIGVTLGLSALFGRRDESRTPLA